MSATPKLSVPEARALLGLAAEAGLEEAARAFRAAAKRVHPDRPGGDAERFREIVAAYRTIQAAPSLPAPYQGPSPDDPYVEISPRVALEGGEGEAVLQSGRRVRARVSAGARHGDQVRIAGGWRVAVRIVPDDAMQVRGSDLWVTASTPAFVLSEGGRASLETPLGPRTVWISRAAAMRRLVRLEGQGLPARGPHPQGSLYIRLEPNEGAPESPARAQLRKFAAAWAA